MYSPCRECAEIMQEYREAVLDFWSNASDETRYACRVAAKLTGLTEEDAVNADEALRPFDFQDLHRPPNENQARIAAAISRKCQHQHRTGHRINLRNG
jgi:predicted nucleic acid-binding protein